MQRVRARYGAELPPFMSIVRYPGRPVILGMDKTLKGAYNPVDFQGRGVPWTGNHSLQCCKEAFAHRGAKPPERGPVKLESGCLICCLLLTRHDYENNSLRFFPWFLPDFAPSKAPGKKDFFKELRMKFVIVLQQSTVCKLGALQRQVDLKGCLQKKIGDFIKFKGFLVEFL